MKIDALFRYSASIIFFQLITIAAYSQNFTMPGMPPPKKTPGYVVLNNGDTVRGLITWRLVYIENNPAEIEFITPEEQRVLTGNDIISFGYTGMNDVYKSVASFKKRQPVFIYRYFSGKMEVYLDRSFKFTSGVKLDAMASDQFRYDPAIGLFIGPTLVTSSSLMISRTTFCNYYIRKGDGPLVQVNKKTYPGVFPALFADCPAIAEAIEKNPGLSDFRFFMILADAYNHLCQ